MVTWNELKLRGPLPGVTCVRHDPAPVASHDGPKEPPSNPSMNGSVAKVCTRTSNGRVENCPLVTLENCTRSEYAPVGRFVADESRVTITCVAAPGDRVPPVADRFSHDAVFVADHVSALEPVFVSA